MKKLISLLATFLLVSVNIITPLSHAQEAPSNNTEYTVRFDANRGTIVNSQIVADGEKVMKPKNPEFPGYNFEGWYSDENLTQEFDFNSSINNDTTLFAKWTYLGTIKDLNVYFIKDDETISHFTIMDRNLGATEVYNQNYENPNTESYGYYYQWGNNYGFSNDVNSYTFSSEQVPYNTWSKYIPSKYASSNFVMGTQANFYNWMEGSTSTDNIWGGRSDNTIDKQGPCPTGYHVPSKAEWEAISKYWYKEREWDVAYYSVDGGGKIFASVFLLPIAGYIAFESNTGEEPPVRKHQGNWATYRASTNKYRSDANNSVTDSAYNGDSLLFGSINSYLSFEDSARANGASVRCFKDSLSPEITINQNGGKKAIIAIDGDKITTLTAPTRDDGKEFKGWYSDEGFIQKIETGSTVPNELFAKWEGDESEITQNIATLLPGNEFKAKVRSITPENGHVRSIKSIKQADEKKEGITDENLISGTGSEKVRAWYDNTNDQGILYYYTDADEIYMNENSEGMFQGFDGLIEIPGLSGWNTNNVTNMNRMFDGCTNLTDISALNNWNTKNVTSMDSLFYQCRDLTDISALSNWNTSNVKDMSWMFVQSNINDISALSGWNVSNVTNMSNMFQSCDSLTNISPLNNWNTDNVINMEYMFQDCHNLSKINLSNWNTSNVINMNNMFEWCNSLEDISTLSGWNVSNVVDMQQMFNGCTSLTGVDLSNWNTSNLTSIHEMFFGCNNLKRINLSGRNINNISSLYRMFAGCSSLTDVSSLSKWNTSNVTDMSDIFNGCSSLTDISSLSNWNTSNVTDMGGMFEGCSNLTDISALSNWNINKVSVAEFMFNGCSSLTGISALSNWNTNNLTTMRYMFAGCSNLMDISALNNWTINKVYDMNSMFKECSSLTGLDLNNWNTSSVTYMSNMFEGCSNLEKIYTSNKFTTENIIHSSNMFSGCIKLVGGNGTTYDTNHIDAEYARIDGVNGLSGYFTAITNEATNGCIGMNQANVTATATQGVITLKWNAISGDTVQISLFDPNDEAFKNLGSVNMASGEFNYTMQWNGVHNFVLNNGCSDFHYQFNVSMSELYPDEFINAYNWAYENGLTTEPNIEEANMYGVLTNLELADIMGKYAENVLNQTPDSNKSCTFDDISTLTQEEQNIIKKACQLGLMPGDKTRTSFNPNDTGNRATFGTALSRAIWGDTFEGGTPYYSGHLKALKAADIINQIDNPEDREEIKGYVLAMLMRAAPVNDEINCDDPMVQLVCMADPEECPAACRTNKCDVNSDGQIGIGDQVRYTNNCIDYTTIVPGKEKCDVNGDGQIGIGDQVAIGNCMSGTGSNSGNSGGNSNSQNSTTKKEEPKSQGYSGGGGGRSSTTKASGGNSTTKTDNNKKASTENAKTTTTPTNAKGNTNITTNKKQPIDYMVPTINKVKYNEGNSSEVLENGFTRERNNAYGFAYANGITTIKNIEKVNMNGAITRAAMAKMLSNYAINVLGKEPDTSKTPHFGDISKETDRQYDNGITLAYQLGIMGVGTKNFRPYDPVTRKEFVTVLSRMLYNTTDGTSKTNYYEPHMAKLYDEGIITKTNPATIEKRGNVMTMLMRSAK